MQKDEAEKILLAQIKETGLSGYSKMNGEGRARNNEYYCFFLKTGEQRFWTNPSEAFRQELGID
jgi:hypothetical protein